MWTLCSGCGHETEALCGVGDNFNIICLGLNFLWPSCFHSSLPPQCGFFNTFGLSSIHSALSDCFALSRQAFLIECLDSSTKWKIQVLLLLRRSTHTHTHQARGLGFQAILDLGRRSTMSAAPFLMLPVHLIHTWPSEIWGNLGILKSSAAISKNGAFSGTINLPARVVHCDRQEWCHCIPNHFPVERGEAPSFKHDPAKSPEYQAGLKALHGCSSWWVNIKGISYQNMYYSIVIVCPQVLCIYISHILSMLIL